MSEAPISRLHRWFTEPVVELEDARRELYGLTTYTCFFGLLSYLSYIPLFAAVGAERIAALNVVVSLLLVGSLVLVRRGAIFGGMTLASSLVTTHAIFTTLTLGHEAGFQLHVVLALELGLLFTYVPLRTRLLFASVFITAFVGLNLFVDGRPPELQLDDTWRRAFLAANSFIFVTITVGIATFYAYTVREKREARDRSLAQLEASNETLLEAKAALAQARDAAQDASRAKSMFLANMSHELRTPLNAIIGYSEMIAEEAEDENNHELVDEVQRIRSAGHHLLSLINDILDLSKIEAGRMECERVDFDLSAFVQDILVTASPLAGPGNNELELELADDLGQMQSDPTKLKQVLLNLLSNACKFTRDGRIVLRVRSEPRAGAPGLCFEVADTGIGIPAEKLEQVFGEFSQADGSTTRRFGGTGLGLTITRRFCEMMGGSIEVESEPERGSTFTVWLPRELPPGAHESLLGRRA